MEGLSNLLRLTGTQHLQTRRGRGIFSLAYGKAVSGARHSSHSFGILTPPPTPSEDVCCHGWQEMSTTGNCSSTGSKSHALPYLALQVAVQTFMTS